MQEQQPITVIPNDYMEKNRQYMNMGIHSIGIESCVNMLTKFINAYPGKKTISVGSGNAILESLCNNDSIICVDPKPLSFCINHKLEKPFVEPLYATVDDLIKNEPEHVDNSILYLGWCTSGNSTFDMEAVTKLKPHAFLSLNSTACTSDGVLSIAGGDKLHNFLSDQSETKEYEIKSVITKCVTAGGSVEGFPHKWYFDVRLEWWERTDLHLQKPGKFAPNEMGVVSISKVTARDYYNNSIYSLFRQVYDKYKEFKKCDELHDNAEAAKKILLQIKETMPYELCLTFDL